MTTSPGHGRETQSSAAAEPLTLRARPRPITRINRRVLIGSAAVLLLMISSLVLVALKPPSLYVAAPPELINTEHKAITEGLARLPATYEGVRPDAKSGAESSSAVAASGPQQTSRVSVLSQTPADAAAEFERVEKARLARLAGQARESQLFFRLASTARPREAPASVLRPDPIPRPDAVSRDDDLGLSTALRAAERARIAAGGDFEGANDSLSEQTHKLSFLKAAPEKDVYNPHGLQKPASPYQLMAGTVISASLVTGLNADLPGFVIAQVTENVFDTVSGRYLLIPQGSRLVGRYDNVVAFGQERALVVWHRIITPDGNSIVIDNLPATDTGGYAGLEDQVDPHTWKLLKGVALATVLGIGSQLAVGTTSSGDSDLVKALQQSVQSTTNRAGQRLVERNLNVQPTITVRPGWPLRVIVHKDLVLRPYRTS
jgi:type IV secretion system protein VirB10